MAGEKNSDVFVMLLPVGKSCHIEAGVAYGLGKKCILIGEQKEAESLYLIFNEIHSTVEDFFRNNIRFLQLDGYIIPRVCILRAQAGNWVKILERDRRRWTASFCTSIGARSARSYPVFMLFHVPYEN